MTFEPFTVDIPEERIVDLKDRLRRTRFPMDTNNEDWKYGTNAAYLESFVQSWLEYDWRATEREINSFDNFRGEINGVPIHFLHARGKGPNPLPLILSHGWPWTFWDYKDVIGPLTDPAAYGGDPSQSFDVVIPSLPGFGFSTPLTVEGIGTSETADIWAKLMQELGYERFGAAGGDWGVSITAMLAHKYGENMVGIHTTIPPILGSQREGQLGDTPLQMVMRRLEGPPHVIKREDFPPDEQYRWDQMDARWIHTLGHVATQTTSPQTLSYGMHDSPAALAAWILERRHHYSDNSGNIEEAFSRKFLLDLISIYWLTDSFVTSARYYWHSFRKAWTPSHNRKPSISIPVGVPLFPKELVFVPRKMVEEQVDLVHWTPQEHGGHFAASEAPDLWSKDVRLFFETLR